MGLPWLEEEDAAMRLAYPHMKTADLAKLLQRSVSAVYKRAEKLGLCKSPAFLASPASGRTNGRQGIGYRFTLGHSTWNKGKPGLTGHHPNTRRTQFKKGELQGAARHNWVPIGTEKVRDGLLVRKMTDDQAIYPASRWTPVARLVWEAANGPIPAGILVVFKAGRTTVDRDEITLDRLELVSRAENMRRNSYHTRYPKEVALLIQLKGALNRKINNWSKTA